LTLKGADVTNDDRRRMVDLMVTAADGMVSPETEAFVRRILEEDPEDEVALYYMGALYYQTDRADVALRLWRPIAENGDPSSFHVAAVRSQIEDAAFRAGVKYTLPDEKGPSAADIANAQDMTEEDRQNMIRGMVAQLAGRLADEGGPASDWARLIGAYGVLGETDKATEVWLEASEVFASSGAAMSTLRAAATAAGVAE
jgi:cytochrome c-type biogenesis protein CcmH